MVCIGGSPPRPLHGLEPGYVTPYGILAGSYYAYANGFRLHLLPPTKEMLGSPVAYLSGGIISRAWAVATGSGRGAVL